MDRIFKTYGRLLAGTDLGFSVCFISNYAWD